MRFEKITTRLLLAAVLITAMGACQSKEGPPGEQVAAGTEPIRIGYMICDGLEETKSRFEPLTRFLAEGLGQAVEAVYLNTYEIPEAYEKGLLDLTHTNSLLYVIMREKGLEPLAGEKRGSLGFMSAGGIVVRADSPIKGTEDLAGKRMVFGPQLAPTGFLTQYEMLLEAGLDPEMDLDYYAIPWGAFKHEKVVYGVWMGAYDAAAVPLLDLEFMIRDGKVGPDDLRIIARGDPIPYCVFGASPRLPPGTVARVRTLLMNLLPSDTVAVDGEVLSVLKSAGVDGFVPLEDSDFDRVREMARKAKMPPYQEF